MIEELEAVIETQKALRLMEQDSSEESKEAGQWEELGAKIRAVEEFFKELLEIGAKIETQL